VNTGTSGTSAARASAAGPGGQPDLPAEEPRRHGLRARARAVRLHGDDLTGAQRLHQHDPERRVVGGEVRHVLRRPELRTTRAEPREPLLEEGLGLLVHLRLADEVNAHRLLAGREHRAELPPADVRGREHEALARLGQGGPLGPPSSTAVHGRTLPSSS
jgi:hypothetical protein